MIMTVKLKNSLIVLICSILLFTYFGACLLKPAGDVSESERRPLKQFPTLSVETVLSGKFMSDFEGYASDQFPLRDWFRSVKAMVAFYLMGQSDVNSLYAVDGYISKLEYPMQPSSIENAANKFRFLFEKYLQGEDVKVYLSIIPDKNYFLAEANGYLSMDYDAFVSSLREQMDYVTYIDIFGQLSLPDYYRTDTHWRQENILPVAQTLMDGMGADMTDAYTETVLPKPFYGVYYGQSALPLPAEDLIYLQSDTLSSCEVFDYETNQIISVYDMEKGMGKDPYELFLSGSKSLLSVKNPHAKTDRKLILFRDSFGSSIAPLLVEGYSEVILVDIRYLSGNILGNWITFENCDVLFLYSTLVLNNSITFK